MNDDRSLERAARSWLEEGPTQAPDRAVEAALLRIDTTSQERGLRIPWRLPNMNPIAKAVLAAAIGVIAIGGALYVVRPATGPGGLPTPSPSPTRPAGPLQVGTYFGPELQIADILAAVDADPTLSAADRMWFIEELGGKSTFTASLRFIGGEVTQRQIVDGVTDVGSFGRYDFPDDRTLVLTETVDGVDVVTEFELTLDGDSFTPRFVRASPPPSARDALAGRIIFESGPFTLGRP